MAEPIFHETTERVYGQLPQHYRNNDALNGYPLKKYLDGLLSSQQVVDDIIDRISYTPLDVGGPVGSTSALVNPMTADLSWLKWLGQLFGMQVKGAITDETRQEIIRASGFRAGTKDSVIAAAQKVLVGTKKTRLIRHADESWQPNMVETIYRTNLAPRPNFVNVSQISSGGGATIAVDTSWSQFGTSSMSVSTNDNNTASAAYVVSGSTTNSNFVNFQPGETYTVSGYMRIPAVHTTTGASAYARRILISYTNTAGITNTVWKTSATAVNAIGVTRLSVTFTVPNDAQMIGARVFNGSATNGDTVQFDGFLIEKTGDVLDFFDGNTATSGGYSYRWLGAANASPSQKYIPAVENTAGPWDMLIMTLQSETLKNLLMPSLAQTLSPAAWDTDFESFGFDPNNVYKRLVDQVGMYQDRAFSFSLRDPEWQASVTSDTGYGSGGFGVTPFGVGATLVSTLRLRSNTSFPATPGDSYQFLVSLGLQQDIRDEKRSAIGIEFFNAAGTSIQTESDEITVEPDIVNNSVVSHNFIKSTRARNYGAYANDASTISVSNYGKYQSNNILRATVNNAAPTTELGLYATPVYGMGSVNSGQTFTFSLDVNIGSLVNANQIRVFFRDDANGDNEAASFYAGNPASIALPLKNRWHRYSWTATVNAGRTVTSAYVVVEGVTNQPTGAYIDTANWLLEEGAVANPYFNGYSADYKEYRFQWDGVEEASITNKVLISVAESNEIQMKQFETRSLAPAGAATAKVFVDMDGFNGRDTLLIAQPGVREEEDTTWVPKTADPVQAVLDAGVKPAGVRLWWLPLTSDWDTITAEGTRPWSELDDLKWVEVEEIGQ